MESEKTQKYIDENECTYPMEGYVAKYTAETAAEIAEQEAEERMRQKAFEAFKFACTDNYGGECWVNDDHHMKCCGECVKMNDFIQKLNEE